MVSYAWLYKVKELKTLKCIKDEFIKFYLIDIMTNKIWNEEEVCGIRPKTVGFLAISYILDNIIMSWNFLHNKATILSNNFLLYLLDIPHA